MAKDIDLTWDVSAMAGATDIDTLEIFVKSGDHSAETDMAVFRTGASSIWLCGHTVDTYTDYNRDAGQWTYGIFSKNQGGFGPGDLIDTALVVI